MSLFGRILDSVKGIFGGTPERVSTPSEQPQEIERDTPQRNHDDSEVTYPRGWSQADRDFWNKEVDPEFRRYYTGDEWDKAQHAFEQGWMYPHRPLSAVERYRDEFFELSTMDNDMFDWGAFREWYASQ